MTVAVTKKEKATSASPSVLVRKQTLKRKLTVTVKNDNPAVDENTTVGWIAPTGGVQAVVVVGKDEAVNNKLPDAEETK